MKSFVLFGDSLAKGVLLDEARGQYILCRESCVSRFIRDTGMAVSNFARFGATVSQGMAQVQKHLDRLEGCDRVILEFGGNDCNFNWAEIAAAPRAEHLPQTPLADFTETYRQMIRLLQSQGARPVLFTLPPLYAPDFFRWVSRGLDDRAILEWLGDVEHIYRWQEMYSMAVCTLANTLSVPLFDMRSVFLTEKRYSDYLCSDGMHPNLGGQLLMAKALTEAVRSF